MKLIIASIALLLLFTNPFAGWAQEALYDEPMIVYKKQIMGGLHLHTAGWGGTLSLLKNKTAFKARVLQLDILGMKSHKEVKSYNPYYEDARSYFYGKANSLYVLRPGWGQRKVLYDKLRKNGVELSYIWSVGPSIGIVKPVYLEIGQPSLPYEYVTVERYDVNKHYQENIYGRASAFNGIGEISFYPGLFGKFGLIFEYSPKKVGVKGLETGLAVDVYGKRIPIMALEGSENRWYYVNFYLNILFGQKYNKNK